MPRNIHNDTPSAAQLSDLIRPIVKSEIRRRDGAITSVMSGVDGAGLLWNTSTLMLDVTLLGTGGLQFTTDAIGIKCDPAGPFSTGVAGLASPYMVVSGAGAFTFNAPVDLNFLSINGNVGFQAFNGSIGFDASNGNLTAYAGTFLFDAVIGDMQFTCDIGNIIMGATVMTLDGGSLDLQPSGGPIGFFGATPITRPGAFTLVDAPTADSDLDADAHGGAYTANPSYTSADGDIISSDGATLADLNDLRADVESLAAVLRQLIKNLGDTSGLGLIEESGY